MSNFNSKKEYSPSEDAALIEQVATNDQLPTSIHNVMQLADQFCHNNNSQREVQLCVLTLLPMLKHVQQEEFLEDIYPDQIETLQRNILMRFGDCQLSKATRRMCGEILLQVLALTHRHSRCDMHATSYDTNSLPWPTLFDQLLQVADDESRDATLRQMSLLVFAKSTEVLCAVSHDVKFLDRSDRFFQVVKRWLGESNVEFAIAAAECMCVSFFWYQFDELPQTQAGIINTAFGDIVPLLLLAYRHACDVDEYDAEKQTQFAQLLQVFFDNENENTHSMFEEPDQYQHLCDIFMPICRKNVGKNREIVDDLCSIMINLIEFNPTIHEFIATTPGEITKLFNFFVDLMCGWLEVEYDAEDWPQSFRPLSEDDDDTEEFYGFIRASEFVSILSQMFEGKEVSTLIAQMLEHLLDISNNNNNNNNNDFASSAPQKIPFNSSAGSSYPQNIIVMKHNHPQWTIYASVLRCFGWADQTVVDRLKTKKMQFLISAVRQLTNHDHPFVRCTVLECIWQFHRQNILLTDCQEYQSTRKMHLKILASKMHAAQDCYRVQELAGIAIRHVYVGSRFWDANHDFTESNISDVKEISIPNLLVQSIFDSLSNHESKPNFVISSHLRALADVCEKTSSEHPLNFNDQFLPLLQHLVQKYHSILLQEIESSNNNNTNNNTNGCDDDDEEESEFSRKARLDPSFKFDLECLADSVCAATRVFKFVPHSEENQIAAKELTSFVLELLETLHVRAKDQILVDLLDALGFLCTHLGKNNFPNDCGGADLVDRMMPPLIHYAMLNHVVWADIDAHGIYRDEVSEEIVNAKETAVDIICDLCDKRGDLMKQKWTSSLGEIIIHLLEIEGESSDKMHEIGFDLFVAVGKIIGHPTKMDDTDELEKLAKKNLAGSISNFNNTDEIPPEDKEHIQVADPEEWEFLTKVANRVVLRFLGLESVLDFENNFPLEPGIASFRQWSDTLGPNLPNRTPILIACLLPHISPSIWDRFAEEILRRIVRMFHRNSGSEIMNFGTQLLEFCREYNSVIKKATQLQARRQQQGQRRQQELVLESGNRRQLTKGFGFESGNRRQRREESDDDEVTQMEMETLHRKEENQLDEDVLVGQLEQAKWNYFTDGDDLPFAVHNCLKIALAGIPAARVTFHWGGNRKVRSQLEDLLRVHFGRGLLGLELSEWTRHFDHYYRFAQRFLVEDAERGRLQQNNKNNNSVSLPLKTRLEIIMPVAPSLDLSLALTRMTHVPCMMKSVLESDFFSALFLLSGNSKKKTRGSNFLLSCVDTSFTKIVALIRKFKFVPLPQHSGESALKFVLERNVELSLELEKLLVVASKFRDFIIRNALVLSTRKDSLRFLSTELRMRFHFRHEFFDRLETLVEKKPKLAIKIYISMQCVGIVEMLQGLFNVFPKKFTEGKTALSKDTVHFTEKYLASNISAVIKLILEPTRSFAAEEDDDIEETTDEDRNMPLKFIDESATKLLKTLMEYEVLLQRNQSHRNSESYSRKRPSANAEKLKKEEPQKLWVTVLIQRIKKIVPGIFEKAPSRHAQEQ